MFICPIYPQVPLLKHCHKQSTLIRNVSNGHRRSLTHRQRHTREHTHTHVCTHLNTRIQHKPNASALEEFMLSEVDSRAPVREETLSASNQKGARISH